ncbi:hypothetical protein, conserved [Cyanidioschyzon merolae strain 10D]|jgi:hypothetical protein|uniref:HNH nuclease domain-containing protein n=1 Tax=Cyanidioschyzon merolae (strain NIES-3377 / 10D) TaxID=280699 RepID=M1UVJ9_CYAM1|nr:hypothetical protein, conserved [Cyanidioschyzon merolae strain 10D]BAM82031.1 hypothetical protein, conserved [Cyanidioschyzon merolae strain 10D]|eukprot:XP_005538067.1 hypothetical protein, conserved [Cyanidioschyzon merolae strain 10D]
MQQPVWGRKLLTVAQDVLEDTRRDGRRLFSHTERNICWRNAQVVPGRHPRRWRFDRVGNLVCRALHGCNGPLCYEYDHRAPWGKGGRSDSTNCDVLQTSANRWKSDQPESRVTEKLLRAHSRVLSRSLSQEELDTIEYVIYGDILRPDGTRLLELPVLQKPAAHRNDTPNTSRAWARLNADRSLCSIM